MQSLRTQIPVFTAIRTVLNTMQRMVYPFLGVFQSSLGVSLQAISLALALRSLAGAFGPFLASIADSRSRKAGMLLGLLFFVAGTAVVSIHPTFVTLIIAWSLTILGRFVFDPSLQAYLGDRVPYQRRGLVLGMTELSWSFAFIFGVPLVGFLIARYGWIAPFPFLTGLGIISLAVIAIMLPKETSNNATQPNLLHNLSLVFKSKPALTALCVCLFAVAANEAVNLVFGIWLEGAFGLKIAALGAATAVIGLSEMGGESLVVLITDRLGKLRAAGIGLILNCLSALALPFLATSLAGSLAGLFFFYLTFEFTIVSIITMMTEILPEARATLMAVSVASHSMGRALAALFAAQLFSLEMFFPIHLEGIQVNILAAIALDLLALSVLQRMKRYPHIS